VANLVQDGPQRTSTRVGLWSCLALTVAYVVSGKLGLLLAVPPGYATAIFLPAGIAVTAMMLGGVTTLPWTFLGSLLLNVWVGYSFAARLEPSGFAVALLIAAASTLQAAVAGYALRRALGDPAPLDNARDLVRFVVLVPICCPISATLSLAGMFALGAVPVPDLATSWVTWWIGDTLGVLVMLPLLMVLAGKPRALWRSRALLVVVPMVLFFALFVAIFARVSTWETDQSLLEFRLLSQEVADKLQSSLEEQEVVLDQLNRSFSQSSTLSRSTFGGLTEELPQRFSTVQAVEWAPRVEASDVRAFEARQRIDLPGFTISERDPSGSMQPAGDRTDYYPVTYIEPQIGNEEAVGFDLASNPTRRQAIEAAFKTGELIATGPIRLVQEHGSQVAILLMRAVHAGDNGHGIVLAVLRMGAFVTSVTGPITNSVLVQLVDVDAGAPLHDGFVPGPPTTSYEKHFNFGTRRYLVRTEPTQAYLASHRMWQSWGVLVRGLLSTGLLGTLLMLGSGQTYRFERQVEERTGDLRAANERLRQEFAERQQAEAALRQAQKMEAVGQLTGGLAHDFNNLLTIIAGNLELLKAHVRTATGNRLIAAAERGTERGARLTQSLLAFSRHQNFRPDTVDINRLIGEFGPLLHQAAGHRIELQFILSPDLAPCRIDAPQFQAALLNLVTNARDALPATGGRILIETANLSLEPGANVDGPTGACVGITVTDTGEGMPPDVAARAFEPFYTTKEVGKGSGLGLSQVYGFAKQSGGIVQLSSEAGVGTTVQIILPRTATAPTAAPDDHESAPLQPLEAGATILVVDDDEQVLVTTADMVASLGYHVLTAPDGPAALALIARRVDIDLLLTDYVMPNGMMGDELSRRARSLRRHLKVLLVSGYAMTAPDEAPDELPLLHKPYRQEELARAIRAALVR
jgi:signal transduction histidine kinase/CHASE1-domain containing sensor protein/CheY-like chemotaxis protein